MPENAEAPLTLIVYEPNDFDRVEGFDGQQIGDLLAKVYPHLHVIQTTNFDEAEDHIRQLFVHRKTGPDYYLFDIPMLLGRYTHPDEGIRLLEIHASLEGPNSRKNPEVILLSQAGSYNTAARILDATGICTREALHSKMALCREIYETGRLTALDELKPEPDSDITMTLPPPDL